VSTTPPSKPNPGAVSVPDIQQTDPKLLSRMLGAPEEPEAWRPEDLAAMLRHQLAANLSQDMEAALPGARVTELARRGEPAIATFADLLFHPRPPLELLTMLKDFAKVGGGGAEDAQPVLPRELASVFYFGAIALVTKHWGKAITSLPPERVEAGLLWTLRQSWLDDATRSLLLSVVPQE
jgi:hypothetical protein